MDELSDRDLLNALGVQAPSKVAPARTAREERIIAGFEDVQRFVVEHGRAPRHGEGRDIFERLYAVRLDRMRSCAEMRGLLEELDTGGLLTAAGVEEPAVAFEMDDAALLTGLGVDAAAAADITTLTHVRPRAEITAAEEIASQRACADFARFKPLFAQAQADLDAGRREARPFLRDAAIETGQFFILGGQTVHVAETGETIRAPNGESDARLRVIYANGTESDLLRRSLQRALYKDKTSRRITNLDAGPLFGSEAGAGDQESGTIYVLRSLSEHPEVASRRDVMHKIGVTGGSVEDRVRGAANDPTFLFAEVEVVASWRLHNINRAKLEALLHRVFAPARFDLSFRDRWNREVKPREWFLAPLPAIDEAVRGIADGSIVRRRYDPTSASLLPV